MIELKSVHNVTHFGRKIVTNHPDAAAAQNSKVIIYICIYIYR